MGAKGKMEAFITGRHGRTGGVGHVPEFFGTQLNLLRSLSNSICFMSLQYMYFIYNIRRTC